jgi:hypothetical protein
VKAALHKLAAEIELATPASERWCVNTEDYNESGRVYLELADATPAEAARGMALLEKLRPRGALGSASSRILTVSGRSLTNETCFGSHFVSYWTPLRRARGLWWVSSSPCS